MWPGFWNSIRVRLVCEELQWRAVSRELRAVLTERERVGTGAVCMEFDCIACQNM